MTNSISNVFEDSDIILRALKDALNTPALNYHSIVTATRFRDYTTRIAIIPPYDHYRYSIDNNPVTGTIALNGFRRELFDGKTLVCTSQMILETGDPELIQKLTAAILRTPPPYAIPSSSYRYVRYHGP